MHDIGDLASANFRKLGALEAEKVKTIDSLAGCLFTDHKSETFKENLEHMFKRFGFNILEEKSCRDREGLISYLAERVHKKFACIYCCREASSHF